MNLKQKKSVLKIEQYPAGDLRGGTTPLVDQNASPVLPCHLFTSPHANHLVQTQAPSPGTELIAIKLLRIITILTRISIWVAAAFLAFMVMVAQETHKTSQLSESNLCIKSEGEIDSYTGERRGETVVL